MSEKLQSLDTATLEAIRSELAQLPVEPGVLKDLDEKTKDFNIPTATFGAWQDKVKALYRPLLEKEEYDALVAQIEKKMHSPAGSSHFLAYLGLYHLESLVETELKRRTDGLAYHIEHDSVEALISLLDRAHLLQAIHLGLIETVGKKLPPENFAQLLGLRGTSDSEQSMLDAYATLFADYKIPETALSTLTPNDRARFLEAIQDNQPESTASYSELELFKREVERYLRDVQGQNQEGESLRALYKDLIKLPSGADISDIKAKWIAKHPAHPFTQRLTETPSAQSSSSRSTPSPAEPSYDDLPENTPPETPAARVSQLGMFARAEEAQLPPTHVGYRPSGN